MVKSKRAVSVEEVNEEPPHKKINKTRHSEDETCKNTENSLVSEVTKIKKSKRKSLPEDVNIDTHEEAEDDMEFEGEEELIKETINEDEVVEGQSASQQEIDEVVDEEKLTEESPTELTKAIKFNVKEFRKQLQTSQNTKAIQEFILLCSNKNMKKDHIRLYLENGGSCLELIQLLEDGTNVPQVLVLEAVNHVLLKIVANLQYYSSNAYDACKYFLNSHILLINKMLGQNSSNKERISILKLLTTMVMFSDYFAKEILLHVNFYAGNLETLTKPTSALRDTFINFLIAFLVNGHIPIIHLFLNKRGLLTSIIRGLKHDIAEKVCMVLSTIKKHVLENPQVSKTMKMRIFSTPVIKDIVNLYNWKGRGGIKNKNKLSCLVEVDEYAKSSVSLEVHSFLLVLCTSHKFGIIFRDHSLGTSKKHQNSLMYTILTSLEKPWEHSYVSELVCKICGACPDLVKNMWDNLKPHLPPTNTHQWLKAIKFTMVLLDQVPPKCMEFCAKELNVQQYAQIIQMLVSPTHVLKTIIFQQYPRNFQRREIFKLFEKMLQSVQAYKDAARTWYNADFNNTLKILIDGHIRRNFPQAKVIFHQWNRIDDTADNYEVLDHLEVVLNIFELYNDLCVNLLDSLLENLQFSEVMSQIESIEGDYMEMQIRAIKFFTTLDPGLLLPNNEIFPMVVPKILQNYHATQSAIAKNSLRHLLRNTGIFEGCEIEIDLWINALNNVKTFDNTLGEFFVSVLKKATDNSFKYLNEINQLLGEDCDVIATNLEEIIDGLREEQGGLNHTESTIKKVYFSPLILTGFECLRETGSKSVKQYMNYVILNIFHYQTNWTLFNSLIKKNEEVVPSSLKNYLFSWEDEVQPLQKFKGKNSAFELISTAILQGDLSMVNLEDYNNYNDLLQMVIFYLTNLKQMDEKIYLTCLELAKTLCKDNFEILLTQPLLLQKFSPLTVIKENEQNYSSSFVLEIIPYLNISHNIDNYLNPFRTQLKKQVLKLIKKRKIKNIDKLMEIVELLQFNYKQCKQILLEISKLDSLMFVEDKGLTVVYHICNYCLNKFTAICGKTYDEPLDNDVVSNIGNHLCYLNENNTESSVLANNLLRYLEIFPHNCKNITEALFKSILVREENCKENTQLALHILKNRKEFITILHENLESTVNKKGLLLPILDSLIDVEKLKSLKEKIYKIFEPNISKALQKPQKAGQHFENHYKGLCSIVKDYMPEKSAQIYINKIQKFDTTEIFHVNLLKTIFKKFSKIEKTINNSILTFIHLIVNLFKRAVKMDISEMITPIATAFNELLNHFKSIADITYNQVETNESYKLFCKFCLKFGVGDNVAVTELLITIIDMIGFQGEDGPVFMDMITSHSEFLNTILDKETPQKKVLLKLFLLMCQKYEVVMNKMHMPVLLGGYSATLLESDQIILQILKLYETVPAHTGFYDFKPFLWGTAASNHYSVRSDIQRSLFRQPRVGDVLDILEETWVLNTIKYHPLDADLKSAIIEIPEETVYDLRFLLPLFSQLLAPENNVPVYRFTKSGALSLSLLALSSEIKEVRMAACHILARFHHHVESRQAGKDNKLWVGFIEAVCRGTAVFEEFHLNNFVSIFFARMALILTRPPEVMYLPLSQYLGAKSTPNLSSIPELYTFFHSSDVQFKHHRLFILKILKDGLRTKKDLNVFSKAMAHKLSMEIFTSVISDLESKLLILDVVKSATNLKFGVTFFCNNYGLLSWLLDVMNTHEETFVLKKVLSILLNVINSKYEDLGVAELILKNIVRERLSITMSKDLVLILLKCIYALSNVNIDFLEEDLLNILITFVRSKDSEYMLKFKQSLSVGNDDESAEFYVKSLTQIWLTKCVNINL